MEPEVAVSGMEGGTKVIGCTPTPVLEPQEEREKP